MKINKCHYYEQLDYYKKVYYLQGIIYGYPKCCIKNFLNDVDKGGKVDYESVFLGTGYVPCEKCAMLEENTLNNIIHNNRLVNIKFPNQINLRKHFKQLFLQHDFSLDDEITLLKSWL
tara:strand:+ start:14442 stop:14795 length:354 start_codon:yes stop_codon:yes gene_type:complete